jgi:hypothetical protein
MWDRYQRPRRWRGGFFFPFPFIFFFLFLGWGHGPIGLMTVLLPAIILLAFGAIVRNRLSGGYQQPYQNNQPYGNRAQSSYNNPNYYYQQPDTSYTPYQQGYQAEKAQSARETSQESQEGESSHAYPQQEQYQEYEQPQAQYPEQMPPPLQ